MAHSSMQFGPGEGFSGSICQLIIIMNDLVNPLFGSRNLTDFCTVSVSNSARTAAESSGVPTLIETTNRDKGITDFG